MFWLSLPKQKHFIKKFIILCEKVKYFLTMAPAPRRRTRFFGNNQERNDYFTTMSSNSSSSSTTTSTTTTTTSTTPYCPPCECPPIVDQPAVVMVPVKDGFSNFMMYLGYFYGSTTMLSGVFYFLSYASLCK